MAPSASRRASRTTPKAPVPTVSATVYLVQNSPKKAWQPQRSIRQGENRAPQPAHASGRRETIGFQRAEHLPARPTSLRPPPKASEPRCDSAVEESVEKD
jgi:hypothetical protein